MVICRIKQVSTKKFDYMDIVFYYKKNFQKFMMGNFFSQHDIIVFTDVSEEVDDQLALHWLKTINSYGGTFTIVFCPTNHNTSAYGKTLWEEKYLPHSRELPGKSFSTFKHMTLEEFSIIPEITYDYGIIIAPLKGYTGNNLTITHKLFIQGSREETSFNTLSSEVFINKFHEEGKLIEIPSSKCAKMRPTSEWLTTLPTFYQDQIAMVGFKLLIGRMGTRIITPTKLNISQLYSEGLINPEVKPIASNYNATKALLKIKTKCIAIPDGEDLDDVIPEEIHTIVAKKYFSDIFGGDTSLAKDYEGSIACLARMCKAIDIVTEVDMFTEREEVYYSDFGDDFNGDMKLRDAFVSFKTCLSMTKGPINFLNPVYDLFAGMVAIEYIKTQEYYDDYTVDEFFAKVT